MYKMVSERSNRAVATWIFIGVGMLIIQVALGGITRLTGSGLSITEWDVVTGTLPPMNTNAWVTEFTKYKQTPQYYYLNFDFTLSDFKFIYFWEWFHRLWARLIGLVFLIPFTVFLVKKKFKPEMVKPLIILFLLGALQGVVGWIMVKSGLTGDAIYVAPVRLALHFFLAMILVCYAFWFGLKLTVPEYQVVKNGPLKNFTIVIVVLLSTQLVYGALMAGHKAAPAAYTWPDINGSYFPAGMFDHGFLSLIDNRITIHFIHRNLAYLIFVIVTAWTVFAWRIYGSKFFNQTKWLPLVLVGIQVMLGIMTVVYSLEISPAKWGVFEWLAQSHQLVAMFFLLSLTWFVYILRRNAPVFASK